MSENLIAAGIIDPAQLPLDRVRQEIATLLNISQQRIERVECWHHQIWVNIAGVGGKFLSYRRLPLWIKQAIAAIHCCSTRGSLKQLGEILRTEVQRYGQQYNPEAVQKLRQAWAQKSQHLREEEERLKPMLARQQAACEWQSSWQQVLRYCRDANFLKLLAPELKRQSREFADLPEVVQAIEQLHQQRWRELTQTAV